MSRVRQVGLGLAGAIVVAVGAAAVPAGAAPGAAREPAAPAGARGPAGAAREPARLPPGSCSPDRSNNLGMYHCTYQGDPATGIPSRQYWLYVPPSGGRAGLPLVVYLHGCEQTSVDAAVGTRFNELAAKDHFLVVYPQQTNSAPGTAPVADGNGISCWNWFLPEDQSRGTGEPGAIAGITEDVARAEQADPRRIYVDGISAGADMAGIMAATYPDIYAAGAALAGCAYATCSDATGRLAYQAMGSRARAVPFFIEQGTADTVNPFPLGRGLVEQWLGTDELAGDGPVSRTPAAVDNHGFQQTPRPGSGDVCVYTSHYNYPCPGGAVGFQGTYPYTVEHFTDGRGRDILDFWVVHGLEHAYPGGDPEGSYTDPLGPDITLAAYQFLASHPMTGSGPAPAGPGVSS